MITHYYASFLRDLSGFLGGIVSEVIEAISARSMAVYLRTNELLVG